MKNKDKFIIITFLLFLIFLISLYYISINYGINRIEINSKLIKERSNKIGNCVEDLSRYRKSYICLSDGKLIKIQ